MQVKQSAHPLLALLAKLLPKSFVFCKFIMYSARAFESRSVANPVLPWATASAPPVAKLTWQPHRLRFGEHDAKSLRVPRFSGNAGTLNTCARFIQRTLSGTGLKETCIGTAILSQLL